MSACLVAMDLDQYHSNQDLPDYAYDAWKETFEDEMKYLSDHISSGLMKVKDCEEISSCIECFIEESTSFEHDDRTYDYSDSAQSFVDQL